MTSHKKKGKKEEERIDHEIETVDVITCGKLQIISVIESEDRNFTLPY